MRNSKKKILDAAEELFGDKGIDGASLRAITNKAGVNLGSIYYYFDSKEQLIQEVLMRRVFEFQEKEAEEFKNLALKDKQAGTKELWRAFFLSSCKFRQLYPKYVQFLQHLMATRPEMFKKPLIENSEKEHRRALLANITIYYPESSRDQVWARCEYLLNFMHMTAINYPIFQASLEASGLATDDETIADNFAQIANATLREFKED